MSFKSMSVLLFSGAMAQNIYCPSLTYKGLLTTSFDAWCQSACNQYNPQLPSFCPNTMCQCAGEDEVPSTNPADVCVSPRKCAGNKYIANPGTVASDNWCNATCNAANPDCPCSLCLCDDPCDAGQDLVTINFDEEDRSRFGDAIIGVYNQLLWTTFGTVDPDTINTESGYDKGLQSPTNVAYTRFGQDGRIETPNSSQSFKIISGHFTAAWNSDLKLRVSNSNGQSQDLLLNSKASQEITFDNFTSAQAVDFEVIEAGQLTETGGNGTHIVIDDLTVCVPKGAQRPSLRKREAMEENARSGSATGASA